MSLPIGTALKDGFFKVASRTGAILLAAYLVLNGIYLVALNSTMKAYFTQNAVETTNSFAPAVDLPLAVGAAITVLCSLLTLYVAMVAMRTFVADARDSFQRVDLTGGLVLAFLNLAVGGIVQGILVGVGTIALVIPGVFLAVSLVFMQLFIVVEGDNFVAAMRRSWRLAEGNRFSLFALGLVVGGLTILIAIAFGIGSVVALFAGLDRAVVNVLQAVIMIPISMYTIAVQASAFNLLRGDAGDIGGGESTTADAPSTPA